MNGENTLLRERPIIKTDVQSTPRRNYTSLYKKYGKKIQAITEKFIQAKRETIQNRRDQGEHLIERETYNKNRRER